jgi:hypothetical protein
VITSREGNLRRSRALHATACDGRGVYLDDIYQQHRRAGGGRSAPAEQRPYPKVWNNPYIDG